MKTTRAWAGVFAALLAALPAAAGAKTEDFRWQGSLAPGQELEVKGVNGAIEAYPASGDRVEVVAVKKGRRDDPARVRIEVVEHAGGVTLCAVYPSRSRPNECRPGSRGRLGAERNDVSVDFALRVPAGIALTARTVNGRVEVEDLTGPVSAHTVNGSVQVATSERAEARTVNGSIDVEMGSASWSEPISLETVNGSVTVTLPADVNAEVRASSVNGRVSTEFPLEVPRTWHGGRARGTLGSGGSSLDVETVNGSIRIRRGE